MWGVEREDVRMGKEAKANIGRPFYAMNRDLDIILFIIFPTSQWYSPWMYM